MRRLWAAVALVAALAGCDKPGEGGADDQTASATGGAVAGGRAVPPAAERAGVVRLTPHVIVDRQGFAGLEAVRLLAPAGWRVTSEMAWYGLGGACGVGTAQPVFQMVSPDGLSAIEYGHAVSISQADYQFNEAAMEPIFVDLARRTKAKQQQDQAAMGEQMRRAGSACFIGGPQSAEALAQEFVLPYRRANARVLSVRKIPELARTMEATNRSATAGLPMIQPEFFADAVALDMDFPSVDPRVVERMVVSMGGTRYVNPGVANDRWIFDSYLTIPVLSVRAPRDRFDQTERLAAAVFGSMSQNPAWTAAMSRLQMELSRIRAANSRATLDAIANRGEIARQAREAVSDMQMSSWRAGQASSDRQQAARIDAIYEVERRVDPQSGAVAPVSIHYNGYWSNGRGDILMSTQAGLNPRDVFPGETWTEMPLAR